MSSAWVVVTLLFSSRSTAEAGDLADRPRTSLPPLGTVPEDEEVQVFHGAAAPLGLGLASSISDASAVPSVLVRDANDKAVSFHERASSKDVIDELNRMIRRGEGEGEDSAPQVMQRQPSQAVAAMGATTATSNIDVAFCCPTGWVHVERDIDFTDPKVS